MPAPPVTIYPKVRKHIDLLHRALTALEIPYESFDLAIDEDAKRRWQRAKPTGMVVGLPGYLVGGEWVGTMDDFEDAVETGQLETFLKQDVEHADASQTIGEAELDRLMREMTDQDLDQLVGDLSVDETTAGSATFTSAKGADAPAPSSFLASVKSAVGNIAAAAGSFADDATGQAAVEAPTPVLTPAPPAARGEKGAGEKRTSFLGGLAAAAGQFADEATGQAAVEAPTPALTPAPEGKERTSVLGDITAAAGQFADEATGQAAVEAPTPALTPAPEGKERTSVLGEITAAAGQFADEASGQAAVEAPSSPAESGPKPGEKTLDEVIDETMEKEKEEYEEKKEAEAEAKENKAEKAAEKKAAAARKEDDEVLTKDNEVEAELIKKNE